MTPPDSTNPPRPRSHRVLTETRYEDEHVLSNVLLEHWDDYCIDVIKFVINVNSNAIIKVGLAEMSRHIIR